MGEHPHLAHEVRADRQLDDARLDLLDGFRRAYAFERAQQRQQHIDAEFGFAKYLRLSGIGCARVDEQLERAARATASAPVFGHTKCILRTIHMSS